MMDIEATPDANADHASLFMKKAVSNVDASFRTVAVLPGDNLTKNVTGLRNDIKVGNGLHQIGESIVSSIAGALRYRAPTTYWVEGDKRLYIPRAGDQIVGIIEEKLGEFYKVNIFSSSTALLNKLAFEGATKRNKPELKKGDLLYLRVSVADKDLDTEVTCITSSGSKKEWSTGETVYGELPEGLLVHVSVGKARNMLLPDCAVLNSLGKHFAFEVAVGMNGAVWIRATDIVENIIIRNTIINSQFLSNIEIEAMVDVIATSYKLKRG